MIKKFIAILFAVAVIAVIVFIVVRRGNFSSMLMRDKIENQHLPEPVTSRDEPALPADAVTPDTVEVEAIEIVVPE